MSQKETVDIRVIDPYCNLKTSEIICKEFSDTEWRGVRMRVCYLLEHLMASLNEKKIMDEAAKEVFKNLHDHFSFDEYHDI